MRGAENKVKNIYCKTGYFVAGNFLNLAILSFLREKMIVYFLPLKHLLQY